MGLSSLPPNSSSISSEKLATHREELVKVRQFLQTQRSNLPLFDMVRFTRDLEGRLKKIIKRIHENN
jgi:predicted O-linked N-acetylglucosamine transferase (SPINDLY family)